MSKKLKAAIEDNDAEAARMAIKTVKDLNRKLPGSTTPLLLACKLGADKALEVLIEAGAKIKGTDGYVGNHPFCVAEENEQLAAMRVLADGGLVPSDVVEHALFVAALGGREKSVRFIMERFKPAVNERVMSVATWHKDGGLLAALIEHGADVNVREDGRNNRETKGQTALHDAARGGHAGPICMLAQHGAEIDARDALGRTPLMLLAHNVPQLEMERRHREEMEADAKRPKIIELLEQMKSQRGRSGDHDPADGMAAARALLELGADVRTTDRFGNDALTYCEWESRCEAYETPHAFIALLRGAGAQGRGPTVGLWRSVLANETAAAREAIRKGADVNGMSPPPGSATPLCLTRSPEMVKLLLEAGADPNKPVLTGTPLIAAAQSGELEIVKLLIEAGANIHAIAPREPGDEYIANAYSAAELNDKFEVVDYLRSLGAGMPVPQDWKPLEAGVGMWEDFCETVVKSDAASAAAAIAKIIKGKVHATAYGQSFEPGKHSYVAVQPRGMAWTNVLRITPPFYRNEDSKPSREFATNLAKAAGVPVIVAMYNDTADAVAMYRYGADGKETADEGWDRDTLEELVENLGGKAPEWARKTLAAMAEDDETPRGTQRLETLAQAERFVMAAFGIGHEPGRKVDVAFSGLPAEAFDGVVFVSN